MYTVESISIGKTDFDRALNFEDECEYDLAEFYYTEHLKNNPDDIDTWKKVALFRALGNRSPEHVQEACAQAVTKYRDIYMQAALKAMGTGNFDLAYRI